MATRRERFVDVHQVHDVHKALRRGVTTSRPGVRPGGMGSSRLLVEHGDARPRFLLGMLTLRSPVAGLDAVPVTA